MKTFQERVENGEVRLNRMMENGREPEIIRLLDVQLKFLENGAPEKGVLASGFVIKTKLELIGQTDDENALVYEANDAEQWFCIHVAYFLEEEGITMDYMREEVYHAKRRERE